MTPPNAPEDKALADAEGLQSAVPIRFLTEPPTKRAQFLPHLCSW